ncbi:ammonia channel protein, partial [Paraburkholderia aspalathi]
MSLRKTIIKYFLAAALALAVSGVGLLQPAIADEASAAAAVSATATASGASPATAAAASDASAVAAPAASDAVPTAPFSVDSSKINSGDTAWMLTSTALVLFMTIPGLALFYGGMVRKKSVLAILMQ